MHKGTDVIAVQGVYETLNTIIGSLSGGPVPEHEFDDAMRLHSKMTKLLVATAGSFTDWCSKELRPCGLWLAIVRFDLQGRSGGTMSKLPTYPTK